MLLFWIGLLVLAYVVLVVSALYGACCIDDLVTAIMCLTSFPVCVAAFYLIIYGFNLCYG